MGALAGVLDEYLLVCVVVELAQAFATKLTKDVLVYFLEAVGLFVLVNPLEKAFGQPFVLDRHVTRLVNVLVEYCARWQAVA